MHLSSSYANILGKTNFRAREIPRSGSKSKDGEKEKKEKRKRERLNDGNNNGQATHGARKHAWRLGQFFNKNIIETTFGRGCTDQLYSLEEEKETMSTTILFYS